MFKKGFALAMALCTGILAAAQSSDQQVWLGVELDKVWSEWTFKTEMGWRSVVSDPAQDWTNWTANPTLERSMNAHWDLLVGVPLSYRLQSDSIRQFQTTIQLGTRFNFTPFKRVQTNLLIRLEERYLTTLEPAHEQQQSARTRIRGQVKVPLDTHNPHADTMWYATADAELFVMLDPDLDERFANRFRSRIGLGRKFNYNWRAEIYYTLQQSRRAITDDALTTDHIFRFRLRYFFSRRVK